ncbi:MAG TPA: PKD domain-containing protein, partial [Thermoplasmata archaeon]|nr:PKD domain-containing protein [Thermoplasmata archaeon]
ALGAVGTAVTTVEIQPPLSVNLTSPGREGTIPFGIRANLSGGLPPYSYEFRLSDGEGVDGVRTSPGAVGANFDPGSPGNYSVEVRVTDELGQTSTSTELLQVAEAPPVDSSTVASAPDLDAGALAVALTSILAGLYVYHRHRRGTPARASPERSALPTVRQLMERAQVIDRETLLLLGEEAGESIPSVQTALRTLIQLGEVTTEPGPGNDEVLRWKGTGPPTAASGEDP